MMIDTVVVAVISLIGTLSGTFAGIVTSTKLTTYRLEQLEKKVEQHNNLIDRMYTVEKDVQVMKTEIEDLKS